MLLFPVRYKCSMRLNSLFHFFIILVREHRNELFKFMKEVRSRDPARRMTLRYDKLYIGNDIFFVNDRTRRVERLHQNVDAGTNFSSSLGNLLINDSQVSFFRCTVVVHCLWIINFCGLCNNKTELLIVCM